MIFEELLCSRTNIRAYSKSEMETIMFIILQIFFVTRNFENWGTLGKVKCLDQSRASENI